LHAQFSISRGLFPVASCSFALLLNLFTPLPALAQAPGVDTTVTVTSTGVERSYLLHVPAGYDGEAVPLVLNFHPSGGTPEGQVETSGFNAIADREGFAVAYPAGVFASATSQRTWNANVEEGVDDVQFTLDVIADVISKLEIEGTRIYATGFSGGARMSSRLACALSDVLAAAAPVAGLQYPDDCVPTGQPSIVAFHGRADQVNQYEVTAESRPYWRMGVDTAAEKWRRALDCPAGPMDGGLEREPGLTVRVWPPCAEGAMLMLYISETDGHVWPEGASERIWDFFEAHPRSP
jgi:polyhydroxybutyrate depolymerase